MHELSTSRWGLGQRRLRGSSVGGSSRICILTMTAACESRSAVRWWSRRSTPSGVSRIPRPDAFLVFGPATRMNWRSCGSSPKRVY